MSSSTPYNVALSNNLRNSFIPVVHLVFRFVTGFCGSAFLSVAGGSVSDLFNDRTVAKYVLISSYPRSRCSLPKLSPMALYTLSPFIGPVLGPLISGYGSPLTLKNLYLIHLPILTALSTRFDHDPFHVSIFAELRHRTLIGDGRTESC